MKFRSKIRYIFLALIVTTFSFSQAEAQLWGKLKNAVKNKAEDVVKEEVNKKVSATSEKTKADEEKKKTVQNKKKSSSALAKANTPAQKSKNQKKSPAIITYKTGTPNGDLDIVGLRLGMSPSQVEAILKSRNGDYKILYSRAKLHGAFRLPKDGERAKNAIPGSDYVKNIFASDEGYRLRKKGTQIALYFARPPSKNKLIYVKKTTIFQDEGPTVEAYDKAFMKKYGDEFYSTKAAQKLRNAQKKPGQISFPKRETHHDTKVIRLNSGQKSTNNENLACYRNIGYAIKALETTGNHIDKYKNCGLILTSMHAAQRDIAAVFSYEMSLIDFDELNKSHAKMILFIKENNKKVKQEKLEAASKKDIDLF